MVRLPVEFYLNGTQDYFTNVRVGIGYVQGRGGKFGEFVRIRLVGRGWGLSGMY